MTLANLEDHYDRTLTDGTDWETLLFLAKRPLQSAEGNEIQTLITERLKRLAGSLYRDGALVNGGSCTVDGTTATLEAGEIYLRGDVRRIEGTEITITGTGVEIIGVYLQTTVVTSEDRPALLDPAEGTTNYKQEGAARLVYSIRWGLGGDDSMEGDFFLIHRIQEGSLVVENLVPQIDGTVRLLARYDYESNSNYIVDGLQVSPEIPVGSLYKFNVSAGTANIEGYKLVKPVNTELEFIADPDIFAIENEPHESIGIQKQTITLNNRPLQSIRNVAITSEQTATVVRGNVPNGRDPLPDTSVLSIESIRQGNTVFTSGTDYALNGGRVDWSAGGREPAASTSYVVTYRYITTVVPEDINLGDGTFAITGAASNTVVLVDYSYNLPRWDLLVLSRSGLIERIKGNSSRFNSLPSYALVSQRQVLLAAIFFDWQPGLRPVVNETFVPRVMLIPELRQLQRAVQQLGQLMSEERLQRAVANDVPRAKFGIFVDPFVDQTKQDPGLPQTAVILDGELQLPISTQFLLPDMGNTEPLMLPSNEIIFIDQPFQTGSIKVNPYQAYDPLPPIGWIVPTIDTWTETDTQFLPNIVIRRFSQRVVRNVLRFSGRQISDDDWRVQRGLITGTRVLSEDIGTGDITNVIERQSRVIEFARARRLAIHLRGLGAGEQIESVTAAGRAVSLQVVTADSNGSLVSLFELPAGIPAGEIPIVVTPVSSPPATLRFRSQGIAVSEVLQRTLTRTVVRNIENLISEPVAQTFLVNETQMLTGMEFIVTAVGQVTNPIQVQIKNVEAGLPGGILFGETVLAGADLGLGRKRVTFHQPLLLQGNNTYSVVLLTDDPDHAIALAKIGEFDRNAQQWITEQVAGGALLSSPNAQSWVVHPSEDMTFRFFASRHTVTTQEVSLGVVALTGCTDLLISAAVVIPGPRTTVQFRLDLPDNSTLTVVPDEPVNLSAPVTGGLRVTALLSGSEFLTPVLEPGTSVGVGVLSQSAVYHSIPFPLGTGGSTLLVFYDILAPAPATVTAAALTAPNTWTDLPAPTTRRRADGWVERTHSMALDRPETAIRLTIAGDAATRPRVRNLRTAYV